MAVDTTGYLHTAAGTTLLWSKLTHRGNWEGNFFLKNNFAAEATDTTGDQIKDVNAPIAYYTDLSKSVRDGEGFGKNGTGDRVRIRYIIKPSFTRYYGNSTLRGNEGSISHGYMDVIIDQYRFAVKQVGMMSSQRNPNINRAEFRDQLIKGYANFTEWDIWRSAYLLCAAHLGTTFQAGDDSGSSAGGLTHYTETAHPNTYYYTRPSTDDSSNAAELPGSTEKADAAWLNYIARWYRNPANPITFMEDPSGRPMGVLVVSDAQFDDLRHDNYVWQTWKDAIKPVGSKEDMAKHPLFFGADAYFENLCIYRHTRVWNADQAGVTGGTSEIHGALALGARAIGWANGGYATKERINGSPLRVQYMFKQDAYTDYENEMNEAIVAVYGIVRSDFKDDAGSVTYNQTSGVFYTNTESSVVF